MTDNSPHGSKESFESLMPANWAELVPLIDAVLDAPREKRGALLDELSQGNAARRTEIEKLVEECELDVPLLDRPAVERFAMLFDEESEVVIQPMLGGRYRIDHEVGRGGMARVFLALDTKHDRQVAVKVIRRDVAASLGSERFLREIAIASRLRHPNIIPMYDSGKTDGTLYFVMPYEEGPSLRERLAAPEPLSMAERVSILRDIARALAYAHERGVVHRDVKPDNVLLSGGAAVVSDFGIAKAVSAAQAQPASGVITQAGAGVGTPAYMAPEQAIGDPSTDHRADIYSFGCLAYELFSGKPPFDNLTAHEVIAAHIGMKPVPIETVSPDVPRPLAQLIMRCLEKLPANRPQRANELLAILESGHSGGATPRRHAIPRQAFFALGILAVILVGGSYLISRNVRPDPAVAHEVTVAVLPLVSGGDSVERELAYGLSDEIATALVKTAGVRVMSRRGASDSREERDIDPEKTGKALGAQYLVMGSLRQTEGRLTVLAKLVQARDGAVIWADQFDRGVDELGAVREEIARSIGDSLSRKSGVHRNTGAVARPAHSPAPEPYRIYVLAQRALTLRGQSIQPSANLFRRAIELDTLYADAYSGLSLALALTPYFNPVAPPDVRADAVAAAKRALRLDSTLATPHVALGIVYSHAYQWDSASREFQEGVRLRTAGDVEPLVQYGRFLLFRGQVDAGLRQFLIARNTEPASALVRSWVSYSYYLQGHMDSAVVESARAFQSDSTNMTTLALGSLVLRKTGNIAGARNYVKRIGRYHPVALYFFAANGEMREAEARLHELMQQGAAPWYIEDRRAFVMLGAGDTARAITSFERATDAYDWWPTGMAVKDPIYDPMRSNPRFQRLLQRVGLQ